MARVIIAALASLPCLLLLLPAFLMAAAMHLFVSCVRGISRLLEPRFVPWTELMMFDPTLGWRPRPRLDARYLAERDDIFRIVTDDDGWPGTHTLDDSKVVVIGDSFAFGYGIDAGRGFSDLIPGLTVKSIGAPGYSMVQSILLMEQFGARLAGKLVVWFVCLENDLQDNLAPAMRRYRSPFVRPSATAATWDLIGEHINPTPWKSTDRHWKRILPHLCVPGPLADRAYSACDYLIARAAAEVRQHGGHLVLVTIPDPSQLSAAGRASLANLSGNAKACDPQLPDRRIAESCTRHGIPVIVGSDHLSARDYKRLENLHWNQRGHRQVADLIGRAYRAFQSGVWEGLAAAPQASVIERRVPGPNRSAAHGEPPVSIGAH